MSDAMLGWHFLAEDRRLRYGNHEVVEVGRTYTTVGPLVMCRNGMHACKRALDALEYAPGPILCRVRLTGELSHDTDKSVARSRHVLWMADATPILHEFAISAATDALSLIEVGGETVDPRSWTALEVKARWLRGRATNEELDAARDAVWAAARAAARDAARDAARAAARAAARDAAWDAARAAAGAPAWVAAWAAARVAARAAAGDAAWTAAGAPARAAACDAQNARLESWLLAHHEGRLDLAEPLPMPHVVRS